MRPAESLHRPDIKDVGPVIPEDAAFEFDPEREIREEDWRGVADALAFLRTRSDTWSEGMISIFADIAGAMAVIDRPRTENLVNPQDWEDMVKLLDSYRHTGQGHPRAFFAKLAGDLVTLNPERAKELFDDSDWPDMIESVNDHRRLHFEGSQEHVRELLGSMAAIDFERANKEYTEADHVAMVEEVRRERPKAHQGAFYAKEFREAVDRLTRFHPEELGQNISPEDWKEIHSQLRPPQSSDRSMEWLAFANVAALLTRLARVAKLRPVTENSVKPLPTTKKY